MDLSRAREAAGLPNGGGVLHMSPWESSPRPDRKGTVLMKRIFMLMALALMLGAAMALSGVAQAASPSAKCQLEAQSLNLVDYKFIGGGDRKNDDFTRKATDGVDEVFCGFGGNDSIGTLAEGDIFLGGAGNDSVEENYGTFNGGTGADHVNVNYSAGTFNGGDGIDYVNYNTGTFNGGDGTDHVEFNYPTAGAVIDSVEVVGPLP
jgi:hypothetical protein